MPGLRATPAAVEAAAALGGDLRSHRSRPLTPELVHAADLIITMGRAHSAGVLAIAPSATGRLAQLDPAGDIEDPIGGDLSLYLDLAKQFKTLVARRFEETLFNDLGGTGHASRDAKPGEVAESDS
jgi:protein-tyrosine-phosphatase